MEQMEAVKAFMRKYKVDEVRLFANTGELKMLAESAPDVAFVAIEESTDRELGWFFHSSLTGKTIGG